MAKCEPGEKECRKCLGAGEILSEKDHFGVDICPKCKGKGTLDWIENIVGVVGTYIKPGVYTREVDYSQIIQPGEAVEVLIASEDYELLGEFNGE